METPKFDFRNRALDTLCIRISLFITEQVIQRISKSKSSKYSFPNRIPQSQQIIQSKSNSIEQKISELEIKWYLVRTDKGTCEIRVGKEAEDEAIDRN